LSTALQKKKKKKSQVEIPELVLFSVYTVLVRVKCKYMCTLGSMNCVVLVTPQRSEMLFDFNLKVSLYDPDLLWYPLEIDSRTSPKIQKSVDA
jgi:hypothetical protein